MADRNFLLSPPLGATARPAAESLASTTDRKAPKEQPRVRRRNRLITSCLECRRRKLKCDKQQPCTNCTKFQRDCLFIAPALDSAGQAKLAEVKEKMGMLERKLEEDVARRKPKASSSALFNNKPLPGQEELNSSEEDEDDLKGITANPFAIEDAAYYEDEGNEGEGNDDIIDLGISMGKLRINERIGGFVRPKFSEELRTAMKGLPEANDEHNPFTRSSPATWMAPGRDYVAPQSSFFFGPGVHKTSLMEYLPAKTLCDKLMEHYWRAVHVIARTVHRPSFESQYEKLWSSIQAGFDPRKSFQAMLFAALLSATVSMSDEKILTEFGVSKDGLVDNFKTATETALAKANFLHTTRLETIQALIMYLIPLCRAEVSRAHSAAVGACIRLAECMGLHRDPTNYTSDVVEIHIRRLIWYQICFLDIRTCEATGPRPQIRRDEFDTRFPLNVDDADLASGLPVTEDKPYFTDMTIMRMRFECYELHRLLWIERAKFDSKKVTLTSILSKIQKFCQAMEKQYLPMFNKTYALHVLAMEIYGILSCRLYLLVLQKFLSTPSRQMPERLRHMATSTAILTMEHSMMIETTPALADFVWYIGALHQYHTALIIISELYAIKNGAPSIERRAWRCLDYVFELPAGASTAEKTRMILGGLADRHEAYTEMRRVRAPKGMEQVGPRVWKQEHSEVVEPHLRPNFLTYSLCAHYHDPLSQQQHHQHQQQHIHHAPAPPHHQPQGQQFTDYLAQVATSQYTSVTSVYAQPNPAIDASILSGAQSAIPDHAPPSPLPAHQQAQRSDSTPARASAGLSLSDQGSESSSNPGPGLLRQDSSPPDMMPEIDWDEWDRLFGTAESTSSFMIPPHAFPQFSAADLQWFDDAQAGEPQPPK